MVMFTPVTVREMEALEAARLQELLDAYLGLVTRWRLDIHHAERLRELRGHDYDSLTLEVVERRIARLGRERLLARGPLVAQAMRVHGLDEEEASDWVTDASLT